MDYRDTPPIARLGAKNPISFWAVNQLSGALILFTGFAVCFALAACDIAADQKPVVVEPVPSTVPSFTPTPIIPTLTPTPVAVRFAVIGDYGDAGPDEEAVANLIKSWHPDFIVTTGDNNYFTGKAENIDKNIGQYYHEFIYPYQGEYGQGADVNRFFPSLGGHDWEQPNARPYIDYFTLPGNEYYYDVRWGPVHLFILDSHVHQPDGVTHTSIQARWLQTVMTQSNAPWKLVVIHRPPYSSGRHGSNEDTDWPYGEWGATAVLSGNDHLYERIMVDGLPYFVNGLGGARIYDFDEDEIMAGSQVRFNEDHGAMLIEATAEQIRFQFITVERKVVDEYVIEQP